MPVSPVVSILSAHAAGALAGFLASAVELPLPWIIGPMVAVAALSLAGLPTLSDRRVRDIGVVVVMTSLGLTFTPAAAAIAASLLPEMILGAVATIALACLASRLLVSTARTDPITAFYATIPGGPVEMSMMGERHGAIGPQIAMSQLLRVVMLVLFIPNALTLSGVVGQAPALDGSLGTSVLEMAGALIGGFLLSLLARRAGLQTAFLLVPMSVGIALSLSGAPFLPIPGWLSSAAQCVLGVFIGTQFQRENVLALRSYIAAAMLNVVVLMIGSFAIALGVAVSAGIALPAAILSISPGGVTEMALTARALHFDVPTVTAFHIVRLFVVLASAPLVFLALKRAGFFGAR